MTISAAAHIYGGYSGTGVKLGLEEAMSALRKDLCAQARHSDVMAAHLEILDDPLLNESIASFASKGLDPVEAVRSACDSVCDMFSEIDDEYIRSRVDDVRDVCGRIVSYMQGQTRDTNVPDGCILVADHLLPSDMASMDLSRIKGIICHEGSSTSHVVIMAHAKGIPVQMGVDIASIREGDIVSVCDDGVGSDVASMIRTSGRRLYANAGTLDDIRRAIAAGAEGIGLFRTELSFVDDSEAPSLERQRALYRDAMLLCEGRPLTIRTFDIGGDKMVPWLQVAKEQNPFLGLRGIRLTLAHPEVLATQLRAVVMAALDVKRSHPEYFTSDASPVRVMLPMVDTPDEVISVREMLSGIDGSDIVSLGIMVETPAAVFNMPSLVNLCDFFSLGTNDLTQYIMAADRGNASVEYLYNSLDNAVLSAVRMVVETAHVSGKLVGICGEAASNPDAIASLASLNIDSFSVNGL